MRVEPFLLGILMDFHSLLDDEEWVLQGHGEDEDDPVRDALFARGHNTRRRGRD